ncbi:hypothetical protein [Deinococcus radiotolerans]|uniref:Uncharacterized protein n=1 Tax=Deinococcus radiotolerans TaxID=1309407 RepID=A0ABQ2FEJ5_9DEIO|nr:hypothetical protein [Deinococcus radiotolerans]GGK90541.1 hypothetical protein GCM10010844_06340 [Deinococcus radiotolerans]
MRLFPALTLTALLANLPLASAQTPPNCALANAVDSGSYATLTITVWSEADEDNAAANWADCRASALRRTLTGQPNLSARMDGLRRQVQQMRALEGQFAGIRAGGGTLYSHAIPRAFPYLEEQLASLAALASTSLGAQTGQGYVTLIAQARREHAAYVATLRAYKPAPDETYTLYSAAEWKTLVNRYEALGRAVMGTLGSRGDAATVLGYTLLNTTLFPADGDY